MPAAPRIEIIAVKPLTSGNLRAIATVRIGALYIHGCRLIQQPGQSAWASPPQSEWTDSAGKTRYRAMLEWPREWSDAITQAIEGELRDHPAGVQQAQTQQAQTPIGREIQARAGVGGAN